MIARCLQLLACLLLPAGLLSAAPGLPLSEERPKEPFIQRVPTNAAWGITLVDPAVFRPSGTRPAASGLDGAPTTSATGANVTNSGAPLQDLSEVVQWNFKRAGKTATLETITRGGARTSIWGMSPSPVAVKAPGYKRYSIMEIGEELSQLRYGRNDYPHTAAVSFNNFAGRVTIKGSTYLVFRQCADPGSTESDAGMVLVDDKTRLPYGATEDRKGYLFQILPSPSTLVPPGEVIKLFKNEQARLDRLNAVPPHP